MAPKAVQKIGKYEIVAELGQGGMGMVYKARDPFIRRMVALKTITPELVSDPEILRRFYREAQSAGTLQHPNIVTIYDLGEAEGRPYIAMEYVEGESIQAIINRRSRLPLVAKLKLAQQFCEGLAYAHRFGVVHRDVKPGNILVTHEGKVKVVDFGIVHLETTNLTKAGTFLGTVHYASPEQLNDGQVDSRTDIWSVTCVIYELISYRKAFEGNNILATISKILSKSPARLSHLCPGLPDGLEAIVHRGLEKRVEDRYQSLDEMLSDLIPITGALEETFIGGMIIEAKELRQKGDYQGAGDRVRAALALDNTHPEALRLFTEITGEVLRVGPAAKSRKLVADAESALNRQDYSDALRILASALELNPADTQARNLKEKVLFEQNRAQAVQEALSSGQRAMKQGDLTGAERDLHRVLELDQENPQAAEILAQILQDRLARERDFRQKEALWQADNLVFAGNYEDAQAQLLLLQQEFPDSEEIRLKLQILSPLIEARRLVQAGSQAFERGALAEAVEAFTQALALDPHDKEVRSLRDRAQEEHDRIEEASGAIRLGEMVGAEEGASAADPEFQQDSNLAAAGPAGATGQAPAPDGTNEQPDRLCWAFQLFDTLVEEEKFDDARSLMVQMQEEFPDSAVVAQKLREFDQDMRVAGLLAESQQAFTQGEYGESVRLLTEAQALDPDASHIRELRLVAMQERDRLRCVREAISAGQRAMRQGNTEQAEQALQQALELDPANAQATALLAQVINERQEREMQQRLHEGMTQVEALLSSNRLDEAELMLREIQQAYPDVEDVHRRLQEIANWKAAAAALTRPPAADPPATPPSAAAVREGPPLGMASASLQWAEDLQRALQTPAPQDAAPSPSPAAMPSASPDSPPESPKDEAPPGSPPAASPRATLLFGTPATEPSDPETSPPEAPPPGTSL